MDESSVERSESARDLQRLVLFSDAVFAIVITLLVLPLTSEADLPGADLAAEAWDLWPRVINFVVSFLVVGQFWIVHHRMFNCLSGCDEGLLRVNLLTLLTVSFMPFPAAMLREYSHGGDSFPVVFYAVSLSLTSVMFTVTWLYAQRRGLVAGSFDRAQRREGTTRSLIASGVFLVSIGAAFFGLWPAVFCWLVLLPVMRNLAVRRQRSQPAAAEP